VSRDRGQAHTLEGVVAAILLLSSLTFALQVTAVTPLSASTSSQHIENQMQSVADGVLAVSAEDDHLKDAVLFWGDKDSDDEFNFYGAPGVYYTNGPPDNEFGEALSMAYGGRAIAYNVYVSYQSGTGSWVTQRMVYRGRPSDNAISASRTVTLYDSDCMLNEDETTDESRCLDDDDPSDGNDWTRSDFYAPNLPDSDGLYNVVRVEVVAWRM
jgi:hypothetical protein